MSKPFLMSFLLSFLMTAGVSLADPPKEVKEAKEKGPKTTFSLPDLTLFLAPPPAQDSDETKAEIKEVLKLQKARTAEQAAAATADQQETGFEFADVMGADFTAEKLPLTAALLHQVHEAEGDLTDGAKEYFHRPRPYVFDPAVKPCVKLSKSFSYPSGHATGGTAMAILLAHMVPEKKDAILARGLVYAQHRILGGAHYRSDIVAGQRAGVLLAEALMQDPDFLKEYWKARAELRKVLKLE